MRRDARSGLRLAVDCLPRHTREAMLAGIRANEIVVGAYVTRDGGVCPMLAAHRNGGRTDFLAFAIAWDRFANAKRPRRATRRELRTLEGFLLASMAAEADLDHAISDHQSLLRSRRAREAAATGWGWLAEAETTGRRERVGV
jgi:urease accessory protein UreF